MDTRQFHKRCFALLLACALALGCLPRAQAASRSAIESLQSQQASLTVQKAELQKKLDGIRSSQGQALNKKNLVEQQLNVLKQQIQVSENLLAQYARQITEKEAELEQAKAKEAEYQAEFEQRVRAMEERGNVSYWSVLFQASNFSDLLDRIDMIGEIMDARRSSLGPAGRSAAGRGPGQDRPGGQPAQGQQETLAQQQSQQAQLQAQQAEVDQLIQEIATQGDVYAKQIEKLEATQDDVAQQIAEAEATYQKQLAAEKAAAEKAAAEKAAAEKAAAEQAAKAAQAAAQKAAQQQKQQSSGSSASGSSGSSSSSGRQSSQTTASASGFLWPIASSHRVTSPFGWRTHPITGRQHLHGGIDIAAPNGTPIMASKAGVVVISQYGSSYGNYVVISHPDGTRTLYAHMSQRNVSAGDTVRQGQTVGLVGSTGSSTGNHLHFETWTGSSSSSRVNPMQFF